MFVEAISIYTNTHVVLMEISHQVLASMASLNSVTLQLLVIFIFLLLTPTLNLVSMILFNVFHYSNLRLIAVSSNFSRIC